MPKPLINQYFCAPKYGNGHKSCGKRYSLLPHTKRRYIVCFVFSVAYLHVYINQFWRKRKMKTNTKRFEKNMPHCHRCTSEAYQQAHTSRAYPGMLQLEHRWAWQRSDKILLLLPCFPFCVNRRARGRMPPQQALGALCKVTNFMQDNPLMRQFWGKSVHKWADLFLSFFQLYFNRFCCYIDIFYTKWYNFYRISHKFSPTVEV